MFEGNDQQYDFLQLYEYEEKKPAFSMEEKIN